MSDRRGRRITSHRKAKRRTISKGCECASLELHYETMKQDSPLSLEFGNSNRRFAKHVLVHFPQQNKARKIKTLDSETFSQEIKSTARGCSGNARDHKACVKTITQKREEAIKRHLASIGCKFEPSRTGRCNVLRHSHDNI